MENAKEAPQPETRWQKIKVKIKPRPGQGTMFIFWVFFVVYYLLAAAWFPLVTAAWFPWKTQCLPALISVLTLLIITSSVLTSLTFWCDRVHFPVLVLLLLMTMLSYKVWKVDHYFPTTERKPCWISLEQAFEKRIKRIKDQNPVILVTATGGGIQAAAWTAEVLFGLEELLGKDFTDSIALISAVSGGSVGAMYYLDTFNGITEEREKSKKASFSNSLDAVAWGILHLDSLRSAGLSFLVPKRLDRGWALEQRWQSLMKDGTEKAVTFEDWEAKIREGMMPIPIFNCTVAETGERLLLAPVQILDPIKTPDQEKVTAKPKNFYKGYPGRDINVVTAVRLSATFPYITPVARALEPQEKNAEKLTGDGKLHIADGGYYDNYGVMTVLDLLHNSLHNKLKGKNVILLQITMFKEKPPSPGGGWVSSMFGPVETMLNVRGSTQLARNQLEIQMIKKLKELEIQLGKKPEGDMLPDIMETRANFVGEPRLSWKLSSADQDDIEDQWHDIVYTAGQPFDVFKICGLTCPAKSERTMATIYSENKWNNTQIKLIEGHRYRYQAKGRWKDRHIECDADGYNHFFMDLVKWLKRVPKAKWFQLVGAVEKDLSQPILLGKGGTFNAPASGILWAFANDAGFAYGNNSGTVELQIDED